MSQMMTEEWLSELDTDRYRPMLRLLHEDDWRFLREQQGFRSEIEKAVRRQRVELFQAYLRMLDSDFRRLCGGLRQHGVTGVLQRQAAFIWRMTIVRTGLAFYQAGFGRVDASDLVSLFDETRNALTNGAPLFERALA